MKLIDFIKENNLEVESTCADNHCTFTEFEYLLKLKFNQIENFLSFIQSKGWNSIKCGNMQSSVNERYITINLTPFIHFEEKGDFDILYGKDEYYERIAF